MIAPDMSSSGKRAVVDIGSNSVRLVIFLGPARAPVQICNEKALCGLGKGLGAGGPLDPASVAAAIATLRRFRRILEEHGDPPTRVVATAAVRDASDGAAFVAAVVALGFDVETIGGDREAALSAMGVVSFNPTASGVVGDMGGGSLELVRVASGDLGERISLPLGPFRLMHAAEGDKIRALAAVNDSLGSAAWLAGAGGRLYAVGGAWRAVARIHMQLRDYPLPVLHQYELSTSDAVEICDLLSHQSRRSLEEIPGLPRKRIETLPLAALVLKAVLLRMKAERMVVSAGGVREGLLYEPLGAEERRVDPLVTGAKFYADRLAPDPGMGEAAAQFVEPLFPEHQPATRRLHRTAAFLIDVAAYFHPDLRGLHAADTALRAPLFAISHAERAFLGLALFTRHEGRSGQFPAGYSRLFAMLSPEMRLDAQRLGLALRFAGALAPKAPNLLSKFRLERRPDALVLTAPRRFEPVFDEGPMRRLESLAAAFDVAPQVLFTD